MSAERQKDSPSAQPEGSTGLGAAEWAIPFVIFSFGLVIIYMCLNMDVAPPAMVGDSMQPRSFPIFLVALAYVLTIVLVLDMLRNGPRTRAPMLRQTYVTIALLPVFAAIAITLDFFLALMVVMGGISWTFGERRIWVVALVALAAPLLLFFAFDLGLGVRFPRGVLTELYY